MLLGTLGASLLGDMLTGKENVRAGYVLREKEQLEQDMELKSFNLKKKSNSTTGFNKL